MNIAKIIFLSLSLSTFASGQSFFKGSVVFGANASQIDGDLLAGYHKIGLTGGVKVEFPVSSVLDLGIEFLYSQRGSRSQIIRNQFSPVSKININYIELPLILKWSDWWIEDEAYYKFNIHGGISNGYLISSDFEDSPVSSNGKINSYDIGFLLGTGFAFTKNWTLTLRYNRSINTLYTIDTATTGTVKGLIGYFITLRAEYSF
ncbi:porin family protein [Portibacter lacus]|uniref:Outer membrane protein beta-barrel domain-containing protein n=1 Tax=Portibacter lacus TaxID=1099794 RepID=A0AA37SWQ4_9BACT|nr:porin family protein [Portibacter lacus]GLR19233.1 hypothetical protein GCM10007940_38490 [Portibacter lacus]